VTIVVLAAVAIVLGHASGAMASWSNQGTGSAAGEASTMPTGNVPRGAASGSAVTIAWSPATFANGALVTGYIVNRYNALNGSGATVGPGCSGVITTASCTEMGLPPGTWIYTETPVQASWTGDESAPSSPILVPLT